MEPRPLPRRPPDSRDYPWYDSLWLGAWQRARRTVREVAPAQLAEFERAFDVLRTRADFEVRLVGDIFDAHTLAACRDAARTLAPGQLEMHEAKDFRRFVVHGHPLFDELHKRTLDRVSELAGEPLEASYTFLSLYGPGGVCAPHIDSPEAKWTLDLCLAQSEPWPLHVGPVVPWPEPGGYGPEWQREVHEHFGPSAREVTLVPGQAALFAGSSQWHWRDPMPDARPSAFCDLLFFHYIPRGTRELLQPGNWARLFGIPQLATDAA